MDFRGAGRVVAVPNMMYGLEPFTRLCAAKLRPELIEREFARAGWSARGPTPARRS
jgi:hypothetical protein